MDYSNNYNLKLPDDTDPVKVSDLSENFEALDTTLKSAFNAVSNLSNGLVKIVTGSYYGDTSSGGTTINVGINVKLFCTTYGIGTGKRVFAFSGGNFEASGSDLSQIYIRINGSTVTAHDESGGSRSYVAIGY